MKKNDDTEIFILTIIWLILSGVLFYMFYKTLVFIPLDWRWTTYSENNGLYRITLRQVISLILGIIISSYTIALYFKYKAQKEDGCKPKEININERLLTDKPYGCGTIVLILLLSTLALEPVAIFIQKKFYIDFSHTSVLPLFVWFGIIFIGFVITNVFLKSKDYGIGSNDTNFFTDTLPKNIYSDITDVTNFCIKNKLDKFVEQIETILRNNSSIEQKLDELKNIFVELLNSDNITDKTILEKINKVISGIK